MTAFRHATRPPVRLSCEPLEDRAAPAGDLTLGPADRVLVVGTDAGRRAATWQFDTDGGANFSSGQPRYEAGFTGGVRTATADLNGDGAVDVVVAPGPGRAAEVFMEFGVPPGTRPGRELPPAFYTAFEPSFTGGAFVSAADFDGDGRDDLVVTPDEGGGPRVRVFGGGSQTAVVADFFGIEDPNFRGGARTAVGDMNGDGTPDLVVAAGFGGGPRVAVFDGTSLRAGQTPRKLFNDFFVFEPTLRNGVFVASGDLNGDGFADVIAGGGPGGGPRVFAVGGKDLVQGNRQVQVANFFHGDAGDRSGVRLAVKDVNGDERVDLVAGSGSALGRVTAYSGRAIPADGPPPVLKEFEVREPFTEVLVGFGGGVFVG